ncbi:MAG: hypothetical protein WAK93_20560, partial [Solirubrobacteraceae bacterium]
MTEIPLADARDEEPSRRPRLRLAVSIAGPLVILGLLVYLVASHGSEIAQAARRASLGELAGVTLLALLALVARTEAVVACLNAMGTRPPRSDIHSANSLTFLAGTINHYLQAVVRGALVKRVDPARAPTIPQMVVVDTAT